MDGLWQDESICGPSLSVSDGPRYRGGFAGIVKCFAAALTALSLAADALKWWFTWTCLLWFALVLRRIELSSLLGRDLPLTLPKFLGSRRRFASVCLH